MKKLDELAAVVAPPPSPKIRLSDDDWLQLFSRLGTRLPQDFVQFHKRYGDGYFYSVSHKRSAGISILGGGSRLSFDQAVAKRLTELRIIKEKRPKSVPFPLYWEPFGLLPWGRTTNDTDLCWRVHGELVDNWKVVAIRAASREFEEYDLTMTEFLKAIASGAHASNLMPKGFSGEQGVAFAAWQFGEDRG